MAQEFNKKNSPYFCFIMSTRAGGMGINLQVYGIVIIWAMRATAVVATTEVTCVASNVGRFLAFLFAMAQVAFDFCGMPRCSQTADTVILMDSDWNPQAKQKHFLVLSSLVVAASFSVLLRWKILI